MYVPDHFAMSDEDARALLSTAVAGDLVSSGAEGLDVTYLPFTYDEEHDRILMHLTRINPQCRHTGEGMLVVHGRDHVVSAEWQPQGSVGTLNYETIVVKGQLVAHDDADFLREAVARLAEKVEQRWRITDVDSEAIDRMLRACIGMELRIESVVGKAKLSQNKRPDVLGGIIDGLAANGHSEDAELLMRRSMPHAQEREALITDLREQHASTREPKSR